MTAQHDDVGWTRTRYVDSSTGGGSDKGGSAGRGEHRHGLSDIERPIAGGIKSDHLAARRDLGHRIRERTTGRRDGTGPDVHSRRLEEHKSGQSKSGKGDEKQRGHKDSFKAHGATPFF